MGTPAILIAVVLLHLQSFLSESIRISTFAAARADAFNVRYNEGSSLPSWACSAVGSAPEWHSGGHRFDPGQVHQPSLGFAELRLGKPSGGCRAVAAKRRRRTSKYRYPLRSAFRLGEPGEGYSAVAGGAAKANLSSWDPTPGQSHNPLSVFSAELRPPKTSRGYQILRSFDSPPVQELRTPRFAKTRQLEIWAISAGDELASSRTMTTKRFVYVLKTDAGAPRYYVGVTSNVGQRLVWHNDGHCTHTAKHGPWRIHVVVEFSDEVHATRFEQYLKSGSGRAFAKRHFD